MLVLSRRLGQKILFPGINASVRVVEIKPGVVRLGVEAPPGVLVLREEVQPHAHAPCPPGAPRTRPFAGAGLHELNHLVRDGLAAAEAQLSRLQRRMQAGLVQDPEPALMAITEDLQGLRQRVASAREAPRDPPDPPRALVVEDDDNERELLAALLRMAGLRVDAVGDGCDALDYLRRGQRPDVVLLDMLMPRCDGPTTVRHIRRDPAFAGLKIFGVSGHVPDEFGLECGPAGVDHWFSKPLDPTALLHNLARELGGRCQPPPPASVAPH